MWFTKLFMETERAVAVRLNSGKLVKIKQATTLGISTSIWSI
jgi:predicted DNA binding CopG/RHH family protein